MTDRPRRAVPEKCTACNRPLSSPLFCDACRALHPADGLNHFQLLGLPPAFDLDPATLRQNYLRYSRGVHPDRHDSACAAVSLRLSAQLNEAHRVLADPVLRAEYLLELAGGPSARDDKSVPPDVLATALMLREEIADAQAAGDDAALESCRLRARRLHDAALDDIAALARQLPGDAAQRARLRTALNAIRYHARLLTEL